MFDSSILFDVFAQHGLLVEASRLSRPAPGNTFQCGFVQPDSLVMGDLVQSTDTVIEYVTSAAPDLAKGEALLVNGAAFRVHRTPQRKGDGTFSIAPLESVT